MRSTYTDRNRTCLVCQFDKLTGFAGIAPGRNVELDSTLTGVRTDTRRGIDGARQRGDLEPRVGVSGRWSVTPNVVLNAAINPDFYQVEADAAQLDVNNRFALFYPEKRPFFLEGSDFLSTPLDVVFTRTVADPAWGVKLTGKEGRNAFALFVAQDEVNNLIFPANEGSAQDLVDQHLLSGVLRFRRDVRAGSSIGVLYTGREGEGYGNHVGGVDALIRFNGSDSLQVQVLGSASQYPETVARRNNQRIGRFGGGAFVADYEHGTNKWAWNAGAGMLSPDFRADSGFVTRVDVRQAHASVARLFRGKSRQWFSLIEVGAATDVTYEFDGQLTDWGWDFPLVYDGPWQVTAVYNPAPNREFFDGTIYDNFRHNISLSMRPIGSLALSFGATMGGTIDFANSRKADMVRLSPGLGFNLGRRVAGTLSHSYQSLDVEGGRLFTANLTQTRVLFHLNLRTYVRAILQYTDVTRDASLYRNRVDPATRRLFSQYLFSYKLNPQTVLLVGYSDNYDGVRGVDLTQTNRTFFTKIGYAWVF
jgi:hypothetical protein